MDYATYWNLTDRPFEENCNTRYFFESEDHREALDRMIYIVNDRNMNMGLLTGEVGSGKTITRNVFQGSLSGSNFEVIGFENSNYEFVDLLYDILKRFSFRDARIALDDDPLPPRSDKYGLMALFKSRLDTLVYEEKRHLVLVFDEAQQMSESTLDEVKNLTNLSSETQNYLTVFLVGQPELREKVRLLRQVDQRIFLRFHLNNLDYNGTVKYIQHRLQIAGLSATGSVFSSLGYERIFRSTGGVPREINRLCKLAMTYGIAHDLKEIRREDVEVVLEDLKAHG